MRGPLLAAGCALLLCACSLAPQRPNRVEPSVPPPPPQPRANPPTDLSAIPDAVPRVEPRSKSGNPPFYEVLGRRYFVLDSAAGYVERGVASWYGPTFHGVNTAMGEPYDMYGMSAAHKTLPLPAYARVTNLSNGRSVIVRINDRGPFIANRLIDLSYTAAAKLGMLRDGTALVEVRAIAPGHDGVASDAVTASTVAAPKPAAPPALYIQAGAFASAANAQHLLERLQAAGLSSAFVLPSHEVRRLYRVRVGPVASVSEFDALAARLARLGIPEARLATD
jgi:rare lipoprotein A